MKYQRTQFLKRCTAALSLLIVISCFPTEVAASPMSAPNPPRFVHVHLLSTSSAVVSWSPPAASSEATNLSFIVRAHNEGFTNTCMTIRLTCTFKGLASGVMYEFWVLAHDGGGNSRSSEMVFIETIAGAVQQPTSSTQSTPPSNNSVPTTQPMRLTSANWIACDAPVGGTIRFSYSNGLVTEVFVNSSGYGGSYPPSYETKGNPGGTVYGYYEITRDNLGNQIPGNGLAFYVSNYYGCTLAP